MPGMFKEVSAHEPGALPHVPALQNYITAVPLSGPRMSCDLLDKNNESSFSWFHKCTQVFGTVLIFSYDVWAEQQGKESGNAVGSKRSRFHPRLSTRCDLGTPSLPGTYLSHL